MAKHQILWVEDSARFELRNLVGPLYFSGKFDFHLAEDVTSAVFVLREQQFDGVIVDIRLPPGIDPAWSALYHRSGLDKVQAQLGLKLLQWLLAKDRSVYAEPPPAWIKPKNVAVFTVEGENEIGKDIQKLGITLFRQKSAGLRDTTLLDLIDELLMQAQKTD
jgi:CheY-like chemotaxis protein